MTDEQINAAIAETCGWGEKPVVYTDAKSVRVREFPNYSADLNAMHDAEKMLLNYGEWETYRNKLICALGCDAFFATARERAETFLRTLGKWEDVQL